MAQETQKKKSKKKGNSQFLLGLFALLLAVGLVSIGVTLAAQQGSSNGTNIVTIGQVKIELHEDSSRPSKVETVSAEQQEEMPDDETGDESGADPEVETGQTYKKEVSVKNIGNYSCYVRILVKKEWYEPYGDKLDKTKTDKEQGSKGIIVLNLPNPDDWTKGANVNGYECYYYNYELDKEKETSLLFDTFTMAEFDAAYNGYYGHIRILAEAVQSEYVTTMGSNPTVTIQQTDSGQKITAWSRDLVFN